MAVFQLLDLYYRVCKFVVILTWWHLPSTTLIQKSTCLPLLMRWRERVLSFEIVIFFTLFNFISTGWKMERGAKSLHCTVLPSHSLEGADQFLADLRVAVETVRVSSKHLCVKYISLIVPMFMLFILTSQTEWQDNGYSWLCLAGTNPCWVYDKQTTSE